MAKAVAKVEEAQPSTAVALVGEDKLISLIEKVAFGPNANMDQVERMLAMVERERSQKAEREFNDAMARAQAKMRPVAADADNSQTRSKYASYAALDKALRPIYTEHGFALSFNTGVGAAENHIRIVCDVTNCGHTRHYQIDMPADGKGAKGGDVMTKTHATGSAVSYGMRYLLKMIFNIAVGEADDDGNAAGKGDVIDEKQAIMIRNMIKSSNANEAKFCTYMTTVAGVPIKRIEDIPAAKFQPAVDALEAKMRAQL